MSTRLLQIVSSLEPTAEMATMAAVSRCAASRGWDTTVLNLGADGLLNGQLRSDGVHVECLRQVRHRTELAWRLVRRVRCLRPDVVHAWDERAVRFGRPAALTVGIRSVFVSYDSPSRRIPLGDRWLHRLLAQAHRRLRGAKLDRAAGLAGRGSAEG